MTECRRCGCLQRIPEAQARLRAEVTPVFADGARPGYRELSRFAVAGFALCAVLIFFYEFRCTHLFLNCRKEGLRVMPPCTYDFPSGGKNRLY